MRRMLLPLTLLTVLALPAQVIAGSPARAMARAHGRRSASRVVRRVITPIAPCCAAIRLLSLLRWAPTSLASPLG